MSEPKRVDVILDAVKLDGGWRIKMVAVLEPDAPSPELPDGATRNRVQTWIGVEHNVNALFIADGS